MTNSNLWKVKQMSMTNTTVSKKTMTTTNINNWVATKNRKNTDQLEASTTLYIKNTKVEFSLAAQTTK